MAFTIFVLAALVVAAAGSPPAARYPAGVSPAACPNYPYCNTLVDPRGPGYAVGIAAPYVYNAVPYVYSAAAPLFVAAGGAKYPSGLSPAECPNYPYCHDGFNGNNAVGTHESPYTGVVPVAAAYRYAGQYPTGVNPAACPNYPFCH